MLFTHTSLLNILSPLCPTTISHLNHFNSLLTPGLASHPSWFSMHGSLLNTGLTVLAAPVPIASQEVAIPFEQAEARLAGRIRACHGPYVAHWHLYSSAVPDGEQPPYSLVPGVRDSPCIPVWEESVLAQSVFPVPSHVPEDPHSPPTPRGQLEQCLPLSPREDRSISYLLEPWALRFAHLSSQTSV